MAVVHVLPQGLEVLVGPLDGLPNACHPSTSSRSKNDTVDVRRIAVDLEEEGIAGLQCLEPLLNVGVVRGERIVVPHRFRSVHIHVHAASVHNGLELEAMQLFPAGPAIKKKIGQGFVWKIRVVR